MGAGAPGGIVASIPTHCTYLKGAAETIGVALRTAGRRRAIKSLLINFLQTEDKRLESLVKLINIKASEARCQKRATRSQNP